MSIPLRELTRLSRFRDFEVIHMGKSYYVSSVILSGISPVVAEMVKKGQPLTYELPPIPGQISKFFDIINGEPIELNESNSLFLYSIASCFDIKELKEVAHDTILSNCNREDVIILASSLFEKNSEMIKELVDLLAMNIDKFIKLKEFQTTNIKLLEQIIKSPKFVCKDTVYLFNYLISRYNEDPKLFNGLLKIACDKYLDPIIINILLNATHIDINGLKESLIPIIISGTFAAVGQSFSRKSVLSINYEEGREMDGIIAYFRNKHVLMNSVQITASSEFSPEYTINHLLTPTKDHFYSSKDGPVENIIIQFTQGILALTQYTLYSCEFGNNGICPTSWIISGSNDRTNWVNLDSRNEDTSLCFSNKAVTFTPSQKVWTPFTYIKFSQVDSGGRKNKRLVLSGIELFGIYTSTQ